MADSGLTLHGAEITVLMTGVDGPVGQDVQRRTLAVHAGAVRDCPVDTGRLRSSIRWTIGRDEHGVVGLVGTDVEYAIYVHEGTYRMVGRPFLTQQLTNGSSA